jgi:rubredoxin
LAELIVELSKLYFEQLNEGGGELISSTVAPLAKPVELPVRQCGKCQSIYDEALADPDQQVYAGTAFDDLPSDYKCWTCGGSKGDFQVAVLENYGGS